MRRGAVFFDYDGTLVDKAQGVPAPTSTTKAAVGKLRENGYLAVLCTGRPLSYLPDNAQELPLDGWITTNGAYAKMGDTVLFNEIIDQKIAHSLMETCERLKVSYALEGQDACYFRAFSDVFEGFLNRFDICTEKFYPIEQMRDWKANKIMTAYDEESQQIRLEQAFDSEFVFDRHSLFTSCDVSRKGVNKGTGLLQFLARLGIPPENAYAIGDSDNDLEMMRAAGTGIAMAQHSPRMGEAADYITDSVANDGAVKALAHFKLI